MNEVLVILLLLFGLALIVLEIMIVPGAVVGFIGVGMMIFAMYASYEVFGTSGGHITVASSLIVTLSTVVFIFRSKSWERLAIKDTLQGKTNTIEEGKINIGDKGKTLSALRPMGTALINEIRVEVRSKGDAIDSQTEIEVVKIDGNRIVVKQLN